MAAYTVIGWEGVGRYASRRRSPRLAFRTAQAMRRAGFAPVEVRRGAALLRVLGSRAATCTTVPSRSWPCGRDHFTDGSTP
jgi:hypothetical protein